LPFVGIQHLQGIVIGVIRIFQGISANGREILFGFRLVAAGPVNARAQQFDEIEIRPFFFQFHGPIHMPQGLGVITGCQMDPPQKLEPEGRIRINRQHRLGALSRRIEMAKIQVDPGQTGIDAVLDNIPLTIPQGIEKVDDLFEDQAGGLGFACS
jgi:hypothetical protein